MKPVLIFMITTGLLAACTPDAQNTVARETAKSILTPIVQKKFPGKSSEMIVTCAVDNATSEEIISLGANAATQNAEQTSSVAGRMLAKPATIECITKGVLGAL